MFRETGRRFWRQPRMDWWKMCDFVFKLGKTSQNEGSNDLMHIGGIAVFLRGLLAFGNQAVSHFRGTEDMDLVSFRPGALEDALTEMKAKKEILGWRKQTSRQFPDKESVVVDMPKGNDPAGLSQIPIDLYQSHKPHSTAVRFNERTFQSDQVISDLPEVVPGLVKFGQFVTPSVRDLFRLKLEPVDTTNAQKLREKDKMDVLWLASSMLSKKGGENEFHDTLVHVQLDSVQNRGKKSARMKFDQLEEIYDQAERTTTNPATKAIAAKALAQVRKIKMGWRAGWGD